MKETTTLIVIVVLVLIGALSGVIAYNTGYYDGAKRIRDEAVSEGFAKYASVSNQTVFVWKKDVLYGRFR